MYFNFLATSLLLTQVLATATTTPPVAIDSQLSTQDTDFNTTTTFSIASGDEIFGDLDVFDVLPLSSIPTDPLPASLSARQAGSVGNIQAFGRIVSYAVGNAIGFVHNLQTSDISKRQQFTQRVVAQVRRQFPMHTIVICNVRYSFSGRMVHKNTVHYNAQLGRDVTYDVIAFDHGTFTRRGDGGYENWAVIPNRGCSVNGGRVSCR